jgi:hypothetical protein
MQETNRELVLTLFNQAKLTDKIIEAQKKNDEAWYDIIIIIIIIF